MLIIEKIQLKLSQKSNIIVQDFQRTICLKSIKKMARFPSGQRGRTVNPLALAFAGSNPALASILRQPVLQSSKEHKVGGFVW